MTTTYSELCDVLGMQFISIDCNFTPTSSTVVLTFCPVGHQYGATTVTLPVVTVKIDDAYPLPLAGPNLADQSPSERSS